MQTEAYIFLGLILNGLLSALVSYVAIEKGRSGLAFFLVSFFLSFPVGILVILALPRLSRENRILVSGGDKIAKQGDESVAKCPFCAEWVKIEASVCKHCGRDIQDYMLDLVSADSEKRAGELAELRAAQIHQTELEEQRQASRVELTRLKKAQFKTFIQRRIILIPLITVIVGGIGVTTFLIINSASRLSAESVPPAQPTNLKVDELGFSWDSSHLQVPSTLPEAQVSSTNFRLRAGEKLIFEKNYGVNQFPVGRLGSDLALAYRDAGFPSELTFEVRAQNKFGTSKPASLTFSAPAPNIYGGVSVDVMIVPVAVGELPEGLVAMVGFTSGEINMWSQPLETTCVYSGVLSYTQTIQNDSSEFASTCNFADFNFSPTYTGAGIVRVDATTVLNGGRTVSGSGETQISSIKMN